MLLLYAEMQLLFVYVVLFNRPAKRERDGADENFIVLKINRDNLFFPHPHFTLMTRDTHHLVIIFIIGIIYLALERSETENDSMIH